MTRRGIRRRYNPGSPVPGQRMDSAVQPAVAPPPGLDAILELAREDMASVDALIRRRLASDVVLVNQVAEYIVNAGGKRLRPMLLLLAAGALSGRGGRGVGEDAHQLAAVVEFIHTATLLHDDVVDESDLRRGRRTANAVWGNAPSVLVGDFLYSRSFQLMVELQRPEVMRILADTTNEIAEGEVLQLLHVRNADTDDALPDVLAAIHAGGSLDYSRERALEHASRAERALDGLPGNPHLDALRGLARYAVDRDR